MEILKFCSSIVKETVEETLMNVFFFLSCVELRKVSVIRSYCGQLRSVHNFAETIHFQVSIHICLNFDCYL